MVLIGESIWSTVRAFSRTAVSVWRAADQGAIVGGWSSFSATPVWPRARASPMRCTSFSAAAACPRPPGGWMLEMQLRSASRRPTRGCAGEVDAEAVGGREAGALPDQDGDEAGAQQLADLVAERDPGLRREHDGRDRASRRAARAAARSVGAAWSCTAVADRPSAITKATSGRAVGRRQQRPAVARRAAGRGRDAAGRWPGPGRRCAPLIVGQVAAAAPATSSTSTGACTASRARGVRGLELAAAARSAGRRRAAERRSGPRCARRSAAQGSTRRSCAHRRLQGCDEPRRARDCAAPSARTRRSLVEQAHPLRARPRTPAPGCSPSSRAHVQRVVERGALVVEHDVVGARARP